MKAFLDLLDRILSRFEGVAIIGFATAALVLGIGQVVLRYVFNTGFHWTEAFFVLCTVAAMLAAGSRAVRDDKHVRVELLPLIIPARMQTAFAYTSHLTALALSAYFAYCGARYVLFLHEMETVSPETGLPDWFVYLLIPVALGAFAIRYVIRIVRTWRGEDIPLHAAPEGSELEGRS